MIVSLCTVTAGAGMEWADFVAMAGRVGYDGVDVCMPYVKRDGVEATCELLARHHVRAAVCDVPVEFRLDDARFAEDMKQLPSFAEMAVGLDCPRMATWVPPEWQRPRDEIRAMLKRRFIAIARVLADHGVRLGLEFISPWHCRQTHHPCVWQMADMLELCIECGDNVGPLLDCWHWHHDPDHSVQAIIDAGRDRIVTVHLNDSPDLPAEQIRDNERLLPGEGIIDLPGFLGALKRIGYDDAITVEVFGRLNDLPAEEAARQALDATRAVL